MDLKTYCEKFGRQTELAAKLGITQGAVWQMVRGLTRISAERAIEIEHATGGEVTRRELRPDIQWGTRKRKVPISPSGPGRS